MAGFYITMTMVKNPPWYEKKTHPVGFLILGFNKTIPRVTSQ
jgi:hypothetical protein